MFRCFVVNVHKMGLRSIAIDFLLSFTIYQGTMGRLVESVRLTIFNLHWLLCLDDTNCHNWVC